jgi:hypothetical protein
MLTSYYEPCKVDLLDSGGQRSIQLSYGRMQCEEYTPNGRQNCSIFCEYRLRHQDDLWKGRQL